MAKLIESKNRINKLIIIVSLVYLLFLCIGPSSISGRFEYASVIYGIANSLLVIVLGLLFGKINIRALCIFLLINILYIVFTLFSSELTNSYGAFFPIFATLLLMCFRFNNTISIAYVLPVYYLITIYIFIIAYLHILLPSTIEIYKNYYTYGYETMLDYVHLYQQPVSIFGTHALAGFYYFLIVLLSWHLISKGYQLALNIIIIGVSILSLFLLKSATGYFFLAYILISGLIYILSSRSVSNRYKALFLLILPVITSIYFILFGNNFIILMVDRILGDEMNGLASRYMGGVLKDTIDYIATHPLKGIGLSKVEGLYYADSDYIITTLRLGILGSILYFIAFYSFIIDNFRKRLDKFMLIFFIFGLAFFMIGNTISINMRIVPFLLLALLVSSFESISVGYSAKAVEKNLAKQRI